MMKFLDKAAVFFVVLAVAIQIEQYVVYGHWWDSLQVHHETFTLIAVGMAAGLLMATRIRAKKWRQMF
jgi:hypothetical protein